MFQCADAKRVISAVNDQDGSRSEEINTLSAIQNLICDGLTDLELETATCKATNEGAGGDWLTCSDVTCESGFAPTKKCYSPGLASLAGAFSAPDGDGAKMAPTHQCGCQPPPAQTPCQVMLGSLWTSCSEVTCGTGLTITKQCYNSADGQSSTDQCACQKPCDAVRAHIATIKSADSEFIYVGDLEDRACSVLGCDYQRVTVTMDKVQAVALATYFKSIDPQPKTMDPALWFPDGFETKMREALGLDA